MARTRVWGFGCSVALAIGCGEAGDPSAGSSSEDAGEITSSGAETSTVSGVVEDTEDTSTDDSSDSGDSSSSTGDTEPTAPAVILMIGDGMGPGQLRAASLYAHGREASLSMHALPHRGSVRTASLSGITDSAAAATTMATGVFTLNGRIGMDADEEPVPTLVEVAKLRGWATAVVTTSALTHATPGAFTAHRPARAESVEIADDQALVVRPDVMLGGGLAAYLPAGPNSWRDDAGLITALEGSGYDVVYDAAELEAARAERADAIVGLFALDHLDYVADRPGDSTQPRLVDMTLAALDVLDRDPDGMFMVVEGARIDMASHGNDLARTVGETLAFDETVDAVVDWAARRGNATVLVTADHECGGLRVVESRGQGQLPEVQWRWGQHTNATVDVFGFGPGAEAVDGATMDHAGVHAILRARVEAREVDPLATRPRPDGYSDDMRHLAVEQTRPSDFGPAHNRLDRLYVDADEFGLHVALDGLFEWERNAKVILVDVDYGAATGLSSLSGSLQDDQGAADRVLSALPLLAPAMPEFGADLAVVALAGGDPHLEDLWDDAGLRGLAAPYKLSENIPWFGAALNYGDGARVGPAGGSVVDGHAFDVTIPWSTIYAGVVGTVPPGATIAIAVALTNDDGDYMSNQFLPPLPVEAASPGAEPTPLPGVVVYAIDVDEDGAVDGDDPPTVLVDPR